MKIKKSISKTSTGILLGTLLGTAQFSLANTHLDISKSKLEFASVEHLLLGAKLKLHFKDDKGGVYDEDAVNAVIKTVFLSNGNVFAITYPKMIYLAGDFIADPNLNISGAKDNPNNNYSLEKLKSNFVKNFNYFDGYYQGNYAGAPRQLVGDFLPKIDSIVLNELKVNKQNIIDGKPLSREGDQDSLYNCATGGKCSSQLDLLKAQGLYMAVSAKGGDHFAEYAITNYLTGHRLALETAAKAKNKEDLLKAYAYEAYADHYLTDSFSSGHQRTPIVKFMNLSNEKEINTLFNIPGVSNILNSQGLTKEYILLSFAKFMHDADNVNGVWTRSRSNIKPWRAYGDDYMFIADDEENIKYIQETAQHGIDQVFNTYKNPQATDSWISKQVSEMSNWLPDLHFVSQNPDNSVPVFAIIDDYLYEPGFRDWSNGSAGSICILRRHLSSIISDKSTAYTLESLLGKYCYNTINGFARVYDEATGSYLTDKVSSTDGRLETIIQGNYSSVRANLGNIQETYVVPIVSDEKGSSCTFLYPIKLKRYGMYTSLDEQSGNTILHKSVTIGHEYLNCNGSRNTIIYSASAYNDSEYMGFAKTNNVSSHNVKLCTDTEGITYLTNKRNECNNWQ